MKFCLVLKLEIRCRVIISLKDFGFFWRIFWRFGIFVHGEIFEFPLFFFCLQICLNVNGKATVWHTPFLCNELLHSMKSTCIFTHVDLNGGDSGTCNNHDQLPCNVNIMYVLLCGPYYIKIPTIWSFFHLVLFKFNRWQILILRYFQS
jgi:hypothetical protein